MDFGKSLTHTHIHTHIHTHTHTYIHIHRGTPIYALSDSAIAAHTSHNHIL